MTNSDDQSGTIATAHPLHERDGAPAQPEGLFRTLVNGVIDYAIFMLDPTGHVSTWNPGARRIKGYAPSEIIGRHFSSFYTPEDRQAGLPERVLQTATEQGRFEGEGWRVRKDGTRFWANVVVDAIRDEAGKLIGFAEVTRDLTDRRLSESALRESEQRFRLLIQSVTDYAIYMLDVNGHVTDWNAGAERIKGYAASEISGRHFSHFYTEEDRRRDEPARVLAAAARDGHYEAEGWRVRKDGTRFWASVVIHPVYDETSRLVGFAKITRDLSEKKRAEEELETARTALMQSQKMEAVGQLTGGIAHDFNNLLTVITNGLDLLAGPTRDEAQRRRIIESALRAAERGAKLTQQLLAFSRQQPLRPHHQDVNDLIAGFDAVLRRACPDTITFEVATSRQKLIANVDGPQFETALLNLVINARDAMPNGGRLRIETGAETIGSAEARALSLSNAGDYLRVSVKDTGSGMSEEVISRACEPFFTTKEVGKGSGLGLSQVYGFAAQSGGQVRIESALGEGTTVRVYLPLVERAGGEGGENEGGHKRRDGKTRVLLVEDDPEVLEVTVEMVRSLGYDVLTAPDAPAALSIIERDEDIDILFSDIVMPRGINGVELARMAMRLRPELRVLLASGYPMAVLSKEHGFGPGDEFAFLNKPYRSADLAEKLREVYPVPAG